MEIEVEIKGLVGLAEKAEAIGMDFATDLQAQAEEVIDAIKEKVPPYPPPPPNSTYIRTGTLGRSYKAKTQLVGHGVRMKLRNEAVLKSRYYPPWVISKERVGDAGPQARIHLGRWYTLQDYVKSQVPFVRKEFEDWIRRVLQRK